MALCLVIHRPEALGELPAGDSPAMRSALADAVWEVAETHWSPAPDVTLVVTDLSPDYLLSHFRRALARRGFGQAGLLVVLRCAEGAAWEGLPAEAAAWLAEAAG